MKDSTTVTIQIGNTDNKLSQATWAEFVARMNYVLNVGVGEESLVIHFFGAPPNYSEHQNAAWVVECANRYFLKLRENVSRTRQEYNQDSAAMTVGDTEFV